MTSELYDLLEDLDIEPISDQGESIAEVFEDLLNFMDIDDALSIVERTIRATKDSFL